MNISHDFFCLELKLCTVVTPITKSHNMSTVTFPRQHDGHLALSIQRAKSDFSFFKKCYLLLLFIILVGVREYGYNKTQAQESLLNSGATNKAFFILGR